MSCLEHTVGLGMILAPQNLRPKNVEEDIAWETFCRRGVS